MRRLGNFRRNDAGSAAVVVGLAIFVLLGSVGSAIDMGRAQMAQAKLSSALDSAGLAAGGTLNSADITTTATSYFKANFPTDYMNVTTRNLVVTLNADKTIINLSVQGNVPTTFMRLFGFQTLPIRATSEITRANKGMELVLVMDVTGSMEDNNKIGALKTAAKDLINILYGNKTTVENLWIGLVPFSQTVNIGPSRTSWVTTDSFNFGTGQAWEGCVDAREASNRDVTDDPPSVAKFPRYFWQCDATATSIKVNNKTHDYSLNGWFGANTDQYTDDSFDSSKMNCATTPSNKFGYKTAYRDDTGIDIHWGPNRYCQTAITPMTSNKSTLTTAIDAMTIGGNTHVNLGAVWGWRMLSPRWRTLWGGEMNTNNLPLNYNTPLMNKVMILLTDGENTMSNGAHSAYWYLKDNKLGTTNATTAVTTLNTRLTNVCNSMKVGPNASTPNNIIVYTIAFGNPGTTISNLLKNCASKPEYFFNSPTNADLQTAFKQIGDSLANLRVSK